MKQVTIMLRRYTCTLNNLVSRQEYDSADLDTMQSTILEDCDANRDGYIDKSELKMLILQQGHVSEREKRQRGKRKKWGAIDGFGWEQAELGVE